MVAWLRQGRVAGSRAVVLATGLLMAAAVAPIVVASPAHAESLMQALAAAYKANPRLDADRARQRATDEEIARANAGFRPTVGAAAEIGRQHTDSKPPRLSDGSTSPKAYSVTASQNVFNGFRTTNQVNVAEATIRAGRETLRTTEQSVLLEAATAYMDVVRDQAVVQLRERNVAVLTAEEQATQQRFKVGEVTKTDVAQAQARRAAAISALDLARANLRTSRATYERVVGHPPARLGAQRPPEKLLPRTLPEATAVALREQPGVIAALYNEQAARHNVDLIRGELLPSVSLDAAYQRRLDTDAITDEIESATATARLNVPLFPSGGEVYARVRQAKHTHVQRLQQIEQARSEAQQAVVAAWSSYQASTAQLGSDRVLVSANRTALAGVRDEQRLGQRTLLDVLDAEQELLNAEVQIATTERTQVVAAYTVLQSIGRLNIETLGAADLAYDAEAHTEEVRRKWWGLSITRPDGRRERHELWTTHGQRHGEGVK